MSKDVGGVRRVQATEEVTLDYNKLNTAKANEKSPYYDQISLNTAVQIPKLKALQDALALPDASYDSSNLKKQFSKSLMNVLTKWAETSRGAGDEFGIAKAYDAMVQDKSSDGAQKTFIEHCCHIGDDKKYKDKPKKDTWAHNRSEVLAARALRDIQNGMDRNAVAKNLLANQSQFKKKRQDYFRESEFGRNRLVFSDGKQQIIIENLEDFNIKNFPELSQEQIGFIKTLWTQGHFAGGNTTALQKNLTQSRFNITSDKASKCGCLIECKDGKVQVIYGEDFKILSLKDLEADPVGTLKTTTVADITALTKDKESEIGGFSESVPTKTYMKLESYDKKALASLNVPKDLRSANDKSESLALQKSRTKYRTLYSPENTLEFTAEALAESQSLMEKRRPKSQNLSMLLGETIAPSPSVQVESKASSPIPPAPKAVVPLSLAQQSNPSALITAAIHRVFEAENPIDAIQIAVAEARKISKNYYPQEGERSTFLSQLAQKKEAAQDQTSSKILLAAAASPELAPKALITSPAAQTKASVSPRSEALPTLTPGDPKTWDSVTMDYSKASTEVARCAREGKGEHSPFHGLDDLNTSVSMPAFRDLRAQLTSPDCTMEGLETFKKPLLEVLENFAYRQTENGDIHKAYQAYKKKPGNEKTKLAFIKACAEMPPEIFAAYQPVEALAAKALLAIIEKKNPEEVKGVIDESIKKHTAEISRVARKDGHRKHMMFQSANGSVTNIAERDVAEGTTEYENFKPEYFSELTGEQMGFINQLWHQKKFDGSESSLLLSSLANQGILLPGPSEPHGTTCFIKQVKEESGEIKTYVIARRKFSAYTMEGDRPKVDSNGFPIVSEAAYVDTIVDISALGGKEFTIGCASGAVPMRTVVTASQENLKKFNIPKGMTNNDISDKDKDLFAAVADGAPKASDELMAERVVTYFDRQSLTDPDPTKAREAKKTLDDAYKIIADAAWNKVMAQSRAEAAAVEVARMNQNTAEICVDDFLVRGMPKEILQTTAPEAIQNSPEQERWNKAVAFIKDNNLYEEARSYKFPAEARTLDPDTKLETFKTGLWTARCTMLGKNTDDAREAWIVEAKKGSGGKDSTTFKALIGVIDKEAEALAPARRCSKEEVRSALLNNTYKISTDQVLRDIMRLDRGIALTQEERQPLQDALLEHTHKAPLKSELARVASQVPKVASNPNKKLFCFDFDDTIVNGHLSAAAANEGLKITNACVVHGSTELRDIPKYTTSNGLYAVRDADIHEGLKSTKKYTDKLLANVGEFSLKNPDALAKTWKTLLNAGHDVTITSKGTTPDAIAHTLTKLESHGLSQKEISKIKIITGIDRKSSHVKRAMEEAGVVEASKVALIDDDQGNISAVQDAIEDVYGIPVPTERGAKPDYLSAALEFSGMSVTEAAKTLYPDNQKARRDLELKREPDLQKVAELCVDDFLVRGMPKEILQTTAPEAIQNSPEQERWNKAVAFIKDNNLYEEARSYKFPAEARTLDPDNKLVTFKASIMAGVVKEPVEAILNDKGGESALQDLSAKDGKSNSMSEQHSPKRSDKITTIAKDAYPNEAERREFFAELAAQYITYNENSTELSIDQAKLNRLLDACCTKDQQDFVNGRAALFKEALHMNDSKTLLSAEVKKIVIKIDIMKAQDADNPELQGYASKQLDEYFKNQKTNLKGKVDKAKKNEMKEDVILILETAGVDKAKLKEAAGAIVREAMKDKLSIGQRLTELFSRKSLEKKVQGSWDLKSIVDKLKSNLAKGSGQPTPPPPHAKELSGKGGHSH